MVHSSLDHSLEGVRVLDLTRLLPGPYCSMLLGYLGAEVIKIEEPPMGDPTRWTPPIANDQGVLFALLNRGKKSLTLNLKTNEGRSVFSALCGKADVVLEGYRPGVALRLGIDYEAVRKVNARIVYCSLAGYDQRSARTSRAGHDVNYLSHSGVLGLTTDAQRQPIIPGVQMADLGGALFAAFAITAGLHARSSSGEGSQISLSLESAVAALLPVAWAEFLGGRSGEVGDRLALTGAFACYNVYRTADDKFVSLGALEPKFWQNFCEAVGKRDLVAKQYDTGEAALHLKREVAELFLTRTRDEWVASLSEADACCEPVLSLAEVYERAGEDAPGGAGAIPRIDLIAQRLLNPLNVDVPRLGDPPQLGQHTGQLLAELGYTDEDVGRLRSQGVV